MPYKSEAQRKFMYARHPEVAEKWTEEGRGHVEDKKSFKKRGGNKRGTGKRTKKGT